MAMEFPGSSSDVDYDLDVLKTTKQIYHKRSIRDIEWLESNGSCMDHLVVRNSPIPHARQVGIANKFIPTGSIVAPIPLVHYPNQTILNMYGGIMDKKGIY
jgi:hypothetical protein